MLLYCNECGDSNGYPRTPETLKGECGLCHRRLGSMNVMNNEQRFIDQNISPDMFETEGIRMRQIEGFVPGTKIDDIEPGAPHRVLNDDRILFFGAKRLVIAIPSTGKKISIGY